MKIQRFFRTRTQLKRNYWLIGCRSAKQVKEIVTFFYFRIQKSEYTHYVTVEDRLYVFITKFLRGIHSQWNICALTLQLLQRSRDLR